MTPQCAVLVLSSASTQAGFLCFPGKTSDLCNSCNCWPIFNSPPACDTLSSADDPDLTTDSGRHSPMPRSVSHLNDVFSAAHRDQFRVFLHDLHCRQMVFSSFKENSDARTVKGSVYCFSLIFSTSVKPVEIRDLRRAR